MVILAHRGYWNNQVIKNSYKALSTALENGFGFESDFRDHKGRLVISHDIADDDSIDAEIVFELLNKYENRYTFAINVKSDGLKNLIKHYLDKYNISNYFLFDMSVPQMVEFKNDGFRFFTRQSDIEKYPCLYEDAVGVWIDGFYSMKWLTGKIIENHLTSKKKLCIVSPELHGSDDYIDVWKLIKEFDCSQIMLCTDYPDKARSFFNE